MRLTLDYEEDYWLLASIVRILGNDANRSQINKLFSTNLDFANKITPTNTNNKIKNAITVVLIKPIVLTSRATIIILEPFELMNLLLFLELLNLLLFLPLAFQLEQHFLQHLSLQAHHHQLTYLQKT